MREFVKVTAVLVFCVSATAAAFVWFEDRPSETTWVWRVVLSAAAAVAIAVFLKVHFRRDLAPDFLGRHCKRFFDCNGFCFSIVTTCEEGVCMVTAMFQNRYDHPCVGRIALRPAVGVFRSAVKLLRSSDFSAISFEVPCGPGSFGVASIPLAVSKDHQGKRLTLLVGASADYPEGKGRMLRFRDGFAVRYNIGFRAPFLATLRVLLLLLGGGFLFTWPGSVTLDLPMGVAESIAPEWGQRTRILWTFGESVDGTLSKADSAIASIIQPRSKPA